MAGSEHTEFLERPETQHALRELAGACFQQIEQGNDESAFPDAAEFLRGRGIEPPAGANLKLSHTVHADGVKPEGPICDDGSRAIPSDCQWIKGSMHCIWTCP